MAIKVTCDGPARFFAVPDFVAGTRQSNDLMDIGGHIALPVSKGIRPVKLAGAGTVTLRPRITRVAMKVMRRYRKTKIKVGLGVEREDGRMWSDPGDWSRTVLVR
jgi:hypothetical protein